MEADRCFPKSGSPSPLIDSKGIDAKAQFGPNRLFQMCKPGDGLVAYSGTIAALLRNQKCSRARPQGGVYHHRAGQLQSYPGRDAICPRRRSG